MEMKKEKAVICVIVIIAITSFGYGIMVGHYNFFPFEELKGMKILVTESEEYDEDSMPVTNVELFIDIENNDDIEKKKKQLKDYIWKNSVMGNSKIILEESIIDERYTKLNNLKQINKISVTMEHGINSESYLFLSNESNNKLIIYHQGHDGDFYLGINTIDFFLKNNYNVLAFSMPLHGMNSQPIVEIPRIGTMKLFLHQQLQLLDNSEFSSMKFFVEPIYASLELIEKKYNFEQYNMIGISGGGWTSTIYPVVDDRISKSFSIAGGLPIALRSNFEDKGDYEQVLPEMYRLMNYAEMYVLASIGDERKHIQIFNKYDPCCYAGEKHEMYKDSIKLKIKELGTGYFESYTDSTHKEHKISQFSLELVIKEMNS